MQNAQNQNVFNPTFQSSRIQWLMHSARLCKDMPVYIFTRMYDTDKNYQRLYDMVSVTPDDQPVSEYFAEILKSYLPEQIPSLKNAYIAFNRNIITIMIPCLDNKYDGALGRICLCKINLTNKTYFLSDKWREPYMLHAVFVYKPTVTHGVIEEFYNAVLNARSKSKTDITKAILQSDIPMRKRIKWGIRYFCSSEKTRVALCENAKRHCDLIKSDEYAKKRQFEENVAKQKYYREHFGEFTKNTEKQMSDIDVWFTHYVNMVSEKPFTKRKEDDFYE